MRPQLQPLSKGDRGLLEATERHLDACFGTATRMVLHEMVSPLIHVDVHIVKPTPSSPVTRLITSGMAERAMTVPAGSDAIAHAELTIALPPDWRVDRRGLCKKRWSWPFRLLQNLARMPHEAGTYLSDWHTVTNGDPPYPYAAGLPFNGSLILAPEGTPEEFDYFDCDDGRRVIVLGLLPLHPTELALAADGRTEELCERLNRAGVSDVVDVDRPSVA
jgi:Suppressor of fused protein (SUFU)